MTDGSLWAGSPRSGARGSDHRPASDAPPRSPARRGGPLAQPAGPAASRQSSASWFDDHDAAGAPADLWPDLVNLGFIGAALRRGKRWWVGLAALGLLLGVTVWAARPPAPEASTTLLLNVGPEGQPGTAILNDQVMAQSRGVAAIALRRLGLRQSIESLQGTYAASVVTDRVLVITASAPTSNEAVRRADTIASAFLAFRADQLKQQQTLQFAALDSVLTQSERHLAAINARIRGVAGGPESTSQQAELGGLRASRARANSALVALKGEVDSAKASAEETTAAMVGQSGVLGQASPVPQSRLKPLVLFSGAGLIIGLFVGAALVILRALISDRLRRRDDVALALGAPVRLSIPATSVFRRRPGGRGLAAAHGGDVQRIVEFLRGTLPTGSHRGALAVVPVDDTRVAALSVLSLAAALAQQNARVVVADLCSGAPAARLVGLKDPGLHAAAVDSAQFEVAIPDPREIAPVGPFTRSAAPALSALGGQVASACASADVLLTLATVDPSLASDHLRSWASRAVVVVTAGSSSWTKVHAVGELIRMAGMRLVSAVLVGADKSDDSLGVSAAPVAGRGAHQGSNEASAAERVTADSATGDGPAATEVQQRPRQQQPQRPQRPSRSQRRGSGGGRAQDDDRGTSGGKTA